MTQESLVSDGATPESIAPENGPAVVAMQEPAAEAVAAVSLLPSACGCGAGAPAARFPARPSLIFAIGQLGYDFGSEARHDWMQQQTDGAAHNPRDVLAYLEKQPWDAQAMIWTLNFDQTPVYAIHPMGAFAGETYSRLRAFFAEQIETDPCKQAERVSIAGTVWGTARLLSGRTVPLVVPDLRGMFNWQTKLLLDKALGTRPDGGPELVAYDRARATVNSFLERVYHERRNLGATAEERAMNYTATNALQASDGVKEAVKHGFEIESFEVERSAHCRPESDCWDVKLNFFDPAVPLHTVRRVCRFTVDVSDVVPVMVGPARHWTVRAPTGR